jgi:hypothetical protein
LPGGFAGNEYAALLNSWAYSLRRLRTEKGRRKEGAARTLRGHFSAQTVKAVYSMAHISRPAVLRNTQLTQHHVFKKVVGGFGHYAVFFTYEGHAYAGVRALLHAKMSLHVQFVVQIILLDQLQKRLDHIVGALDMAGTAYAYFQFSHYTCSSLPD